MKRIFLLVFMVSEKKNYWECEAFFYYFKFLFYNAFLYSTQDQQKKIFHVLVFMENRFYNSESGLLSFILWMNNTKKSNLLPWVY